MILLAVAPICSGVTYEDWCIEYFSPSELSDPEVSAKSADPDGDGSPNFSEFAFGSNPLVNDSDMHPKVTLDSYGHLGMTFNRRKDRQGFVYLPMVTGRLNGPWQFWSPSVEEMLVTDASTEMDRVTVRDSKAKTDFRQRFMKIVIAEDRDGDGLPDSFEDDYGLNADDPSDALSDYDLDGIPNWKEIAFGLNLYYANDAGFDPDADGLTTGIELSNNLDPNETNSAYWDSDGDGVPDYDELTNGTPPSDPFDGQPPLLTSYGGQNQLGWSGEFLAQPFCIRVRNAAGRPISRLPLHVSVSNGTFFKSKVPPAILEADPYIETDSNGVAKVFVKHALNYNSDCITEVRLIAGLATTSMSFSSRVLGDRTVTAPVNMAGSYDSFGRLKLTWQDTSTDETEFVIERSVGDDVHFIPIARVMADITEWIDPHPINTPAVFYRANSTR